jgi:hypothetical protein
MTVPRITSNIGMRKPMHGFGLYEVAPGETYASVSEAIRAEKRTCGQYACAGIAR